MPRCVILVPFNSTVLNSLSSTGITNVLANNRLSQNGTNTTGNFTNAGGNVMQ